MALSKLSRDWMQLWKSDHLYPYGFFIIAGGCSAAHGVCLLFDFPRKKFVKPVFFAADSKEEKRQDIENKKGKLQT